MHKPWILSGSVQFRLTYLVKQQQITSVDHCNLNVTTQRPILDTVIITEPIHTNCSMGRSFISAGKTLQLESYFWRSKDSFRRTFFPDWCTEKDLTPLLFLPFWNNLHVKESFIVANEDNISFEILNWSLQRGQLYNLVFRMVQDSVASSHLRNV